MKEAPSRALLTSEPGPSFRFDEDALAGALLGRLDHGVELAIRDRRHTFGAARLGENLVAVLHVGEPIIEKGEHSGGDLFTQTVSRTEILVDPDLHRHRAPAPGRGVALSVHSNGAIGPRRNHGAETSVRCMHG